MKVFIDPGSSRSVIATIAIGPSYYNDWEKFSLPLWQKYCNQHQLGLIVFDDHLVDKENTEWKKPNWQKLLIGQKLSSIDSPIENVCYLDTDVLINPFAPNVFEHWNPECYGLVSLRKHLPFSYHETLRRMAFYRNKYYDRKYPLDSALFISLENLYSYHNLPVQEDEACTGLILFNIQNHAEEMSSWFSLYENNIETITSGGEQTHVNYHIQSTNRVTWLKYKFQAIWVFEMATKYPFLYKKIHTEVVHQCLQACLSQNYFLHFAGSWHESNMWKNEMIAGSDFLDELEEIVEYMKQPVSGKPLGTIKP